MCGIYGFSRKEGPMSILERHKLRGVVMDLAYRNEARGRDGTGIALLGGSETVVFKEAVPSGQLIKTKRFQKVIRAITDKTQICLGHTRLATIGDVQNKHCHPFVTDHFIGVHNGHFMNRELLLKKYARSAATPVDSEAIFRVLDGEYEVKGMIAKLSQMQGDFAIGFAHREDSNRLYLIRNDERPIHVAYVARLKTLLWSSDDEHLEFALARNGFRAGVWELKKDYLYVADVRNFTTRSNLKKIPCKMEPFTWLENWGEEDFVPAREPRFISYDDLRGFGCFEGVARDEHSKIPCASCNEVVEAGQLFYEEISRKFLCEDCSFDHLYDYEKLNADEIPTNDNRDLFECQAV
jgi:predicted glutamine amidotransferase